MFEGELFADYHQLVVEDIAGDDGLAEYTEETAGWRVTFTPHMLIVFTARNIMVRLRVELHEARPAVDLFQWQHAVEASFAAPSGRIVIFGLTDDRSAAVTAAVPAGALRALVLSAGLDTLNEDGLEGDDRYEVHLWPQAMGKAVVLKQWHEPPAG